MAVTSVEPLHDGWQGSEDQGKVPEFTVVYLVKCDSREDGPETILSAEDLPSIGETYEEGNDSLAAAICKRRIPRARSGNLWHVTCVFGPTEPPEEEDSTEGLDDNGNPTDNPLLERPFIATSFVLRQEPVYRATFLGKGTDPRNTALEDTRTLVVGQFYPPQNSAGDIFDPPLEEDEGALVITYRRNIEYLPVTNYLPYLRAANAGTFEISRPNFDFEAEEATCKVNSIVAEERIRNGVIYFRFKLEFYWRELGWDRVGVDKGFNRRALEGDPLDDGGVISSGGVPPAEKRQILDDRGRPLQAACRLNGDGQPLGQEEDAVWMKWRTKELLDFNTLIA